MKDLRISDAAKGPDIPGLFYIGNCSQAADEAGAMDSYHKSLPQIPRDAFRAIPNRPYGYAVYCEDRFTVTAEAWVTHVYTLLQALMTVHGDEAQS